MLVNIHAIHSMVKDMQLKTLISILGVKTNVGQHSCYSFNGQGYATQDSIRNYDPRYVDKIVYDFYRF